MTLTITDAHRISFHEQGFAIIRQFIEPAFLKRLRRMADAGRELARQDRKMGFMDMRIAPQRFASELDAATYRTFVAQPAVQGAIKSLFGQEFQFGFDTTRYPISYFPTCFYEPQLAPYTTHWHRDWRDNILSSYPELMRRWHAMRDDPCLFNQVNIALYDDASTWFVPASHNRDDLPEETEAIATAQPLLEMQRKVLKDDQDDWESLEYLCQDYCLAMPGAVSADLRAGDVVIYRNSLWHLGRYLPYRKRATLHDAVMTHAFYQWFLDVQKAAKAHAGAG